MPLIWRRQPDFFRVEGHVYVTRGTVDFSGTYPDGGEPFTLADLGLTGASLSRLTLQPTNGWFFEVDYVNRKIRAHRGQAFWRGFGVNVASQATTTEQVLTSLGLSSWLYDDASSMELLVFGTCAANTNTKRLLLKLGAVTILDSGPRAANGTSWMLRAHFFRTAGGLVTAASGLHSDTRIELSVQRPSVGPTQFEPIVAVVQGAASASDVICETLRYQIHTAAYAMTQPAIPSGGPNLSGLTGIPWEARSA